MLLFGKQQIGKAKVVLKGKKTKDDEYIQSTVDINGDESVTVHLLISALIDLIYSDEGKEAGVTLNVVKKLIDEMYKDRKKENK